MGSQLCLRESCGANMGAHRSPAVKSVLSKGPLFLLLFGVGDKVMRKWAPKSMQVWQKAHHIPLYSFNLHTPLESGQLQPHPEEALGRRPCPSFLKLSSTGLSSRAGNQCWPLKCDQAGCTAQGLSHRTGFLQWRTEYVLLGTQQSKVVKRASV